MCHPVVLLLGYSKNYWGFQGYSPFHSPVRNTPENSPNLGVSIGGHPYTGALSLSSHIELVSILHLGRVRCGLWKHCPMFPPFTNFFAWTRDRTRIDCVVVLHANRYTMGPTALPRLHSFLKKPEVYEIMFSLVWITIAVVVVYDNSKSSALLNTCTFNNL